MAKWSDQVGGIVEAAQAAAVKLREETEQRASERIAEADRAATYRVEAAEAEALEVLASAQTEAAKVTAEAAEESERGREVAAQTVRDLENAARAEAERIEREADEYSKLVRTAAAEEAGQLTREARTVAREVLAEGSELSANMSELSTSLRNNAERLLRDVQAAHRQLTEKLERLPDSGPEVVARRGGRAPVTADDGDVDVPEFMP